MVILNSFKSFIRKEYYDFDKPDITLQHFHPQIRICLIMNGIFFNNTESKIRFMLPAHNISISIIAVVFQMIFIFHGLEIKHYAFATECISYLVVIGVVPLVYSSVLVARQKILDILENMDRHFVYICHLGGKHREAFLEGQLLIWKLCFAWFLFATFTCLLYIINTVFLLLYQSLFATQDEHTVRPLIFPMWLPKDDPYRSPNYEIFLFLEIVVLMIVMQSFIVYVYMQFHFLLHYYFIMDMITLDLHSLFDGLEEEVALLPKYDTLRMETQGILNKRMKRIVDWHNDVFISVQSMSSVYGPPLVYQMMCTSAAICLMAYQVVAQLENGKIDFLFALLTVAACIQLWIPCYLGTLLRDKAFDVGEAAWNCGWHETSLGRLVRNDLVIVILRSQKPLTVKFTGLPGINLETFSSKMSAAYSYFNMLRQSTK